MNDPIRILNSYETNTSPILIAFLPTRCFVICDKRSLKVWNIKYEVKIINAIFWQWYIWQNNNIFNLLCPFRIIVKTDDLKEKLGFSNDVNFISNRKTLFLKCNYSRNEIVIWFYRLYCLRSVVICLPLTNWKTVFHIYYEFNWYIDVSLNL